MKPKDTIRPCKHCKQMWYDHPTLYYMCDVDKLPLAFQQMWYSCKGDMVIPKYEPMDNLEYLEWKDLNNGLH